MFQVTSDVRVTDLSESQARDLLCSYIERLEIASALVSELSEKVDAAIDRDPAWLKKKSRAMEDERKRAWQRAPSMGFSVALRGGKLEQT